VIVIQRTVIHSLRRKPGESFIDGIKPGKVGTNMIECDLLQFLNVVLGNLMLATAPRYMRVHVPYQRVDILTLEMLLLLFQFHEHRVPVNPATICSQTRMAQTRPLLYISTRGEP
jgi:hypothetical protein